MKCSEIKLKPCAHCGKSVAVFATAKELEDCANFESCNSCESVCVVCDYTEGGCGSASGYKATPEEAAEVWNRRVDERPKGKWTQPDKDHEWNDFYRCSECGNLEGWDALAMNYCDKCGAKMEVERCRD